MHPPVVFDENECNGCNICVDIYVPPVHEPLGYTFDDMMQDHIQGSSGRLVRKDLLRLVAGNNYDRMLDIEKFGIKMP